MAKNYYCLVAGLREITMDGERKGFDARAIIEAIREELTASDRRQLEMFYRYYDAENLVNLRAGRSHFSTLGNIPRQELEKECKKPTELPAWMRTVLQVYADSESADDSEIDTEKAFERSLFTAYYKECKEHGNRFLRQWSDFDRNLRNVCAAYMARKANRPVSEVVVGDDYVTDALTRNSAADFGLKGELDYLDAVTSAIAEEHDLVDKERRIDEIRWNMAEELTVYDYFNMNGILGYLAKVNIVHRWATLDPATGKAMFDKLLQSLSGQELIERIGRETEE